MYRKQRASDGSSVYFTLRGSLPTTLGCSDRSTGECLREYIHRQQTLPLNYDKTIQENFPREVDVTILDSASSNKRFERHESEEEKRVAFNLWCMAHSKTKVFTYTIPILGGFDSRMIQAALSLDGPGWGNLLSDMRSMHDEQLVVIPNSASPADATHYRELVYHRMFFATTSKENASARTMYKYTIVSRLYNGDIRKRGVVEHYCIMVAIVVQRRPSAT